SCRRAAALTTSFDKPPVKTGGYRTVAANAADRVNLTHQPPTDSIPAPKHLVALEVNAAKPSVDAIQIDMIRSSLQDVAPCLCERQCVRNLNQRMPRLGKLRHDPIKRRVPHEHMLFHALHGDEEPWSRQ